jgi:hypothetical protein
MQFVRSIGMMMFVSYATIAISNRVAALRRGLRTD